MDYHWPHLLNNNPTARLIEKYIVFAAFINNAIIFVCHFRRTFCQTDQKLYHKLSIQWISILALLSNIVVSIGSMCGVFSVHTPSKCNHILNILLICYVWSKSALYTFFIERFRLICKQNFAIKLIFICICIWVILAPILVYIFGDSHFDQQLKQCTSNYPIFITLSIIFIDFVIGTSIPIMLLKVLSVPAKKISNNNNCVVDSQSQAGEKIKTTELKSNDNIKCRKLTKRMLILSLISVITTQLVYVFIILLGLITMFGAIDTIINGWCIVITFITSKHNDKCIKNDKHSKPSIVPPISGSVTTNTVTTTCKTENNVQIMVPKLVRENISMFNPSNTIDDHNIV
eukprot:334218_1